MCLINLTALNICMHRSMCNLLRNKALVLDIIINNTNQGCPDIIILSIIDETINIFMLWLIIDKLYDSNCILFCINTTILYYLRQHNIISEKWKWRDMWPSMVTHTRIALHLTHPKWTHTAVNTHTVNTHPEQWAAIYAAAPGEQLGVRCLAQGHLSHGIEGGESAVHSLPPPTIPAGPETRTRNLSLTSPTL